MVEKQSKNLLKMMSEVCESEDLTETQVNFMAEIIYDLLAEKGYDQDPFKIGRSEVHERLMSGCASIVSDVRVTGSGERMFFGARAFCSIHNKELISVGDVELGCDDCGQAAEEYAAECHLAHLERMADCIAETTDDSTLEENLPYYIKTQTAEERQAQEERAEQESGYSQSRGL